MAHKGPADSLYIYICCKGLVGGAAHLVVPTCIHMPLDGDIRWSALSVQPDLKRLSCDRG